MMKTHTLRWGVLGAGGIARCRTIPEGILAAPHATLVAVYDADPRVCAAVASEFGAAAATSEQDLMGADIDAVYVATPAHLHAAHVRMAAKVGKHVLCEKPLGLCVEESRSMAADCEAGGVILGTALMMRFHSQHRAALDLIRDGSLGEPVLGRAQLSCWYPPIPGAWRQDPTLAGGGSLMDMGGHCLDLLEMFFGPVSEVSCFTANRIHAYASEDAALASLRFANGALGSVDAFFCIPDVSSRNVLELYGSRGSILASGTIGQAAGGSMTFFPGDIADYSADQKRTASGGIAITPPEINTYQAEIEEFCLAILEKRQPENSAEIGIRSQLLLDTCYAAARSGCAQKIPSF
jgi:predicted dehydrogenase